MPTWNPTHNAASTGSAGGEEQQAPPSLNSLPFVPVLRGQEESGQVGKDQGASQPLLRGRILGASTGFAFLRQVQESEANLQGRDGGQRGRLRVPRSPRWAQPLTVRLFQARGISMLRVCAAPVVLLALQGGE